MPNNNNNDESTEGRLTCQKLRDILNGNADKMEKRLSQISDDILEMRNEIIKNLVEENKKLQEKVKNLENKIESIEVSTESTNQYGRRNNLEFSGIPNFVKDEDLEETVKDILEKIEVKAKKRDIEACHRLPPTKNNKNKKVIVRFVNRKTCEKALKVKKKLSDVDMESLNFRPNTNIYINENLNKYFQYLSFRCRELKSSKIIDHYKFQNEMFFIKFVDGMGNEKSRKINHERQLFDLFPDFYQAVL